MFDIDYTALIAMIAGAWAAVALARLHAFTWWMVIIFVVGLAACSAFAGLLFTFVVSLMSFWHAVMLGAAAWMIWYIVLAPRSSPADPHAA